MTVAPFIFLWLVVSFVLYHIGLVIYRLFFHPLSRFPGPKIVATTFWWECFVELFVGQGGEYMNQVEAMHDKYGPIVRVTPDEVHIRDPEWSHVLYAGPGHIRDKDSSLAHAAGTADGSFGTVSHWIHKRRRAPVSSYFSKSSVAKYLFDKIWEQSELMSDVLSEHFRRGSVVNGRAIFLGWSNDSLRMCSFGESMHLLNDTTKAMAFDDVFKAFAICYPILKQCEWMIPLALELPIAPFRYIYTPLATLLTVHVNMIKLAKKSRNEYLSKSSSSGITNDDGKLNLLPRQHTLFHALTASCLPEDEKLPKRIAHEGFEILLAGSDTTARTMGIAAYHIMANLDVKQRLHEELKTVMPNPEDKVDLKVLEGLPWLNAVVKEALRIGKVTDHRLSLVAPYETLQYNEWAIPPGTRVSMTPTRNSYDERYFPNPTKFSPERWLQSEEKITTMNRVFMPFAHGTRGCLGMHFAQAELLAALAIVFRRFDFELFDTVRERDIDHTWAHIAGEPNKKGKGLRFRVIKAY